jgi:hypothetical protein
VGSNLARATVQIAAGRRASIGVMLRAAGLRALRRGPLAAYVVLRAPTAQNLGRAVLRAPSTNPKR